jgi:hypothetical protein
MFCCPHCWSCQQYWTRLLSLSKPAFGCRV